MRCAEKVAATYRVGHRDGYEEGLAAAREALLALPEYALRDTCVNALKKKQ